MYTYMGGLRLDVHVYGRLDVHVHGGRLHTYMEG